MTIVSVYCIFGDREEAERVGGQVVEEGLAACVNILGPCRSIYRWQGRVEAAEEVPAIFKTTRASSQALIDRLEHLHSYEVPAITVWAVEAALGPYADWVEANSSPAAPD